MAQTAADKDIHLAGPDNVSEPVVVLGDSDRFSQVLINLLTNAHQALCEASTPRQLTVTTRCDPAQAQVGLNIADTGPGMSPEVRARIFEPFFTTKAAGVGTGLGLSLCQGIIESVRMRKGNNGGICLHGVSLLERFWQALHPPRYAASLKPSSPSFRHSSTNMQDAVYPVSGPSCRESTCHQDHCVACGARTRRICTRDQSSPSKRAES